MRLLQPKRPNSKIDGVNAVEIRNIWRMVAAYKKEGIYTVITPFWDNFPPVAEVYLNGNRLGLQWHPSQLFALTNELKAVKITW